MMNRKKYALVCVFVCALVLFATWAVSRISGTIMVWYRGVPSATIVIDPGHGGEDGGTTDSDGHRESQINLEISLRLRDLLRLLGARTYMIREDDISVATEGGSIAARKVSDIHNRVRLTNELPDPILISIHQNHFPEEKYRGAQVFYAQTEHSKGWAEKLQEILNTQVDPNNHRSAKAAENVYLLKHIQCPAILVECGFLSNYEEALLLRDPSYQKKLAAAIACSITSYAEEKNEV